MITTVADLLQELIRAGLDQLSVPSLVKHPGSIGDQYEGLTREVMERASFQGLDLSVKDGFVRDGAGNISRQIDCMIVTGSGEKMPFTEHYIYDQANVLMIIEVKKNLYGRELADSLELFRKYWQDVGSSDELRVNAINSAWRQMFGENLPENVELDSLPLLKSAIFKMLVTEATMPAKVIIGYQGFADESSLRRGFVNYLSSFLDLPLEKRLKFNFNSFPNLIICGKSCLIKGDGMPYSFPSSENKWLWMVSKTGQPFYSLLEILWTRIQERFGLSTEIFGDDLEMEGVNIFMYASPVSIPSG